MCNITTGILKSCGYAVGGNSIDLYIGNASGVRVTTFGTSSVVTGITGSFYKVEVSTDTLIDTDNMIIGAAQNKFFEHKVAFKIADSSNELRAVMEDLGTARTVMVIRDKNGVYKAYGLSGLTLGSGLDTKVLNFNSGGASADEYGYTVEAMENFTNPHYIFDASLEPTGTGVGPYTFS